MALIDLLFVFLALYILYKIVFNFIVPVSKVASSVRTQMRNMQENDSVRQSGSPHNTYNSGAGKNDNKTSSDSEYIDFEEIK